MAKKQDTISIGFEEKIWKAADIQRGNLSASQYEGVVLGLIFLKYISDRFEQKFQELQGDEYADPEDKDEYTAENIFFVPAEARWSKISAAAHTPEIGVIIDEALTAIERENERLKGILPKNFARPELDKRRLGDVVDLFTNIEMHDAGEEKDLLGRTYEYCLQQFASLEGKNGGEFYTPSCIVRTLVEILEPYEGRVYDPCCGSGGMFVQSAKFIERHKGNLRKISIYGQEANPDTWKMAQAIFKNWFVDFEPFKDGKFVDSELGMIPEGWKVGTLADIAEITMGQSPAGNSLNENREGMIFYQGSSDFGFRFPSIRVFTTEPKRLAVANSVLFSVRAPVGDINVAKEECCIGRGVASIKSKYGHDSYLFYTMKSLHKLFDSFDGEGTVFGSINKKTLSAIQILLPSDGIVEQFNNIASSFDDRIRSLSDENSRLSLLRDTLLPRLMSGELEVPE